MTTVEQFDKDSIFILFSNFVVVFKCGYKLIFNKMFVRYTCYIYKENSIVLYAEKTRNDTKRLKRTQHKCSNQKHKKIFRYTAIDRKKQSYI